MMPKQASSDHLSLIWWKAWWQSSVLYLGNMSKMVKVWLDKFYGLMLKVQLVVDADAESPCLVSLWSTNGPADGRIGLAICWYPVENTRKDWRFSDEPHLTWLKQPGEACSEEIKLALRSVNEENEHIQSFASINGSSAAPTDPNFSCYRQIGEIMFFCTPNAAEMLLSSFVYMVDTLVSQVCEW